MIFTKFDIEGILWSSLSKAFAVFRDTKRSQMLFLVTRKRIEKSWKYKTYKNGKLIMPDYPYPLLEYKPWWDKLGWGEIWK